MRRTGRVGPASQAPSGNCNSHTHGSDGSMFAVPHPTNPTHTLPQLGTGEIKAVMRRYLPRGLPVHICKLRNIALHCIACCILCCPSHATGSVGRGKMHQVQTITSILALAPFLKGLGLLMRKNFHLYVVIVGVVLLLYRKLLREAGLLGEPRYARRIQGKLVELTEVENLIAQGLVEPGELSETLDDVGGLGSAKRVVRESVIAPLSCPVLYPSNSLRAPPKGVLLHGPPGTGKTLLARTIAKEAKAAFLEVKLDTLLAKYVGDSEKHTAAIFSLARKLQPSIIFIDEVDGLLSDRDASSSSSPTFNLVKTIFMTEWDGLRTSNNSVVVIGATNRPGAIDEAILRRMPVKQRVGYPDAAARQQIINIILRKDKSISQASIDSLDVEKIAADTDGYSGSDLHELCKEAALSAVRTSPQNQQGGTPLVIATSDFVSAMKVVKNNQGFVQSHGHPRSLEDLFKR
eukprot:TRINITY_DN1986_c0_g2_i1.p1 TRINITY_DN1986_c0_g2~~TRINITY_DN1986_c0_g2_i1.p1  ORF type:complete len:462 (+),score=111.08 TRINITY_DN1986_c0_g2_i1:1841-3226(+)